MHGLRFRAFWAQWVVRTICVYERGNRARGVYHADSEGTYGPYPAA